MPQFPRHSFPVEIHMKRRFLWVPFWVWIAFALVSALLVFYPEIDLMTSRFFYTPGVGFEAKGTWVERLIYRSVGFLLVVGNIGLIAWWLSARFASRLRIRFTAKELAFLLLLLALGPGLIVNGLLKENWGRARPIKLAQFGGSDRFTAAFVLSDQEGKSFSSGHTAASAYWIVAVLLLAPRRIWLLGVAIAYSLAVSWMRMAAGGHFLSDVVTSYFIVAILALALYGLFYQPPRESTES